MCNIELRGGHSRWWRYVGRRGASGKGLGGGGPSQRAEMELSPVQSFIANATSNGGQAPRADRECEGKDISNDRSS
ncbi:hypothetical protein EVAR_26699_1 [Eumeta japonica]|uniref:Uncharacterized protein n=1 Tax=Eumeta variegata TaxID=151549 RepID=A0A4C1VKU8_EUMVA|nr:hypothetical protein EVAR_26699_1 [Eumeta japonica]